MASLTRNLVASATNSLPDNTSETVDLETPARRATSTMVTRPTRLAVFPLSASDISSTQIMDRSIFFFADKSSQIPHNMRRRIALRVLFYWYAITNLQRTLERS